MQKGSIVNTVTDEIWKIIFSERSITTMHVYQQAMIVFL